MSKEAVLVLGGSGHIGAAAIFAALNVGHRVLVPVRNRNSAAKLRRNLGARAGEGVEVLEADITTDLGLQSIIERVDAGQLPQFQHVFASVGGDYTPLPLVEQTEEYFKAQMQISVGVNVAAFRVFVPWLNAKVGADSSFTVCTEAQGELGLYPINAIHQGALFSFSTAAAIESKDMPVRFNEVSLAFRVEVDADAAAHGVTRASDFALVYETVLKDTSMKGGRVSVRELDDIKDIKWARKY
ncbi:putative NmrA-like domain, NAD(P)-binding domain superfamily [Septoria linicola]|nr:putative NmrA-like domain, NAD(P)-binding domain superfamily [Septoria linicola]